MHKYWNYSAGGHTDQQIINAETPAQSIMMQTTVVA